MSLKALKQTIFLRREFRILTLRSTNILTYAMLQGKTCVITAGTGGIGKGIARTFLKNGAFVFLSGRSAATVDAVVAEFQT